MFYLVKKKNVLFINMQIDLISNYERKDYFCFYVFLMKSKFGKMDLVWKILKRLFCYKGFLQLGCKLLEIVIEKIYFVI